MGPVPWSGVRDWSGVPRVPTGRGNTCERDPRIPLRSILGYFPFSLRETTCGGANHSEGCGAGVLRLYDADCFAARRMAAMLWSMSASVVDQLLTLMRMAV